jgi:hypothetical protein
MAGRDGAGLRFGERQAKFLRRCVTRRQKNKHERHEDYEGHETF